MYISERVDAIDKLKKHKIAARLYPIVGENGICINLLDNILDYDYLCKPSLI